VTAAKALEDGKIDGFWANGMGTEVAVRKGIGKVVLDIRRGDGPAECFNYTMASIATTDKMVRDEPEKASAAIRAVTAAQKALTADPTLATGIGKKLFPETETTLIAELIRRDLPFYSPIISEEFVRDMNQFARDMKILDGDVAYEDVVATDLRALWK
jgi:ABC-type nitrate/sulfonate/bicarbonate transport system substrate-binding protein